MSDKQHELNQIAGWVLVPVLLYALAAVWWVAVHGTDITTAAKHALAATQATLIVAMLYAVAKSRRERRPDP